jgi:O-antigen ligase
VGPDSFRRRYADLLPLAPSGQRYGDTRVHANSLYFETLADLGLAGVAALAWLVASAGRAAAGRWRSRDALGVGLGVSASTFFVHGVSDYFLEFTPSFALFWLLLGLLAARSMPPGDASAP